MVEISKPNMEHIWANAGDVRSPTDAKIDQGWIGEVPPAQWENFVQNRQDSAIVHLFQKGISVWSSTENYYASSGGPKSYVQGSNGDIYRAVQNSTGQNPVTDATGAYWTRAFRSESSDYYISTGTANNYIVASSAQRLFLPDGLELRFKVSATNTGASTLKVDSLPASPIRGLALLALQGGELFSGGVAKVVWNATGNYWVLLECSGGALQIANATNTQHAITYQQTLSLVTSYAAVETKLYYLGQI